MSPRFLLAALAVVSITAPARAQNLYNDIQREFADENQLQRDVRRYQHDVTTGHYLRAAMDRARIQNDEANLRFDQSRVQTDLIYQSQALVPHPQYSGYYYYPSQPGQLYYYANQFPAQAPPPASVVGPPAPSAAPSPVTYNGPPGQGPVAPTYVGPQGSSGSMGLATPNPVTFNVGPPIKTTTVWVSNPAETGVPINFAVDGTAYNVPSGYTQRITGTTSSVVEFDRGDLFGDGRYRLVDGAYEFRYTDRGWELYKKPTNPPVPSNGVNNVLPRNIPPRGIASSTSPTPGIPSPTGLSPIVPDQPMVKEVVPPPPVPDSATPR